MEGRKFSRHHHATEQKKGTCPTWHWGKEIKPNGKKKRFSSAGEKGGGRRGIELLMAVSSVENPGFAAIVGVGVPVDMHGVGAALVVVLLWLL